MNCAQVKERLVDFLYEEMPPEALASFSAHVQGCPTCKAEVASYQQTLGSARAALGGPLSEEPPARAHLAIVEAAKAAVKQTSAAKSKVPAPQDELGFFARLLRTPWFLPAFGAASVATVVFLVRVLKNPEVLPGQRPHTIEERAVAAPEPVAPPEPVPTAQPAAASAPAVKAKADNNLAEGKPFASTSGARKRRAEEISARVEAPAPIMKKKLLVDHPLDGLTLGGGRAGGAAPSRFAEPPPPRQEHAKSGKYIDDLVCSFEKGSGAKPIRERAANLDDLNASPSRDEELRADRKAPTGSASAKKAAPPEPSAEMAKPATRLPSGYAGQPAAAASPAYAPAPAAMPASPRPARADRAAPAASAPASVFTPPAAKHERMKQTEESKEATVVVDSEADDDIMAKDKAAKGGGKASPSLEETVRKAERLYASQDWNAAADAYRDLLRRFPSHKDAPKWRDRINDSVVAEEQRQAKIKAKAKKSSDVLDGLKL